MDILDIVEIGIRGFLLPYKLKKKIFIKAVINIMFNNIIYSIINSSKKVNLYFK